MEIERAQSENMHKLEDRQGYILDKTHHREQTYTDIEEKLKIQRMQKRREKNRMEQERKRLIETELETKE